MKHLLSLLFLLPTLAFAQQEGVHFEHGLSWDQITAKAKAENKGIFMDCYTTWCGPCKYMSNVIFPQKDAGDFFNEHFINVKVQLDTTGNDNEEVVKWYKDGQNIVKQYKIAAYPTFLFFDEDGNAVHKIVGGAGAQEFVTKSHAALKPETQYFTLLNKYNSGDKSPSALYNFAKASYEAYDLELGGKVGNEYLSTQTDLFTKENIEFLSMFTQSSKDKGFTVMMENPDKFDAVLGKNAAKKAVQNIIMKEEVAPRIFAMNPSIKSPADLPEPDWSNLETALKQKYPSVTSEIVSYSKVVFYMTKHDWQTFSKSIQNYMSTYGVNATPEELNNFAWTVFENCDDSACIAQALDWSKRSFVEKENAMYMDTYANILYKTGKKEEAMKWEEKAVGLADEANKKSLQETLDKMKNGEKTWN